MKFLVVDESYTIETLTGKRFEKHVYFFPEIRDSANRKIKGKCVFNIGHSSVHLLGARMPKAFDLPMVFSQF